MADTIVIPPMPLLFKVRHPDYGWVAVTIHAWERFCERYQKVRPEKRGRILGIEDFMTEMGESFYRAHEFKMRPKIQKKIVERGHNLGLYVWDEKFDFLYIIDARDCRHPVLVTTSFRNRNEI